MEYVRDAYFENTIDNHFPRKEQGELKKFWNWFTQMCVVL